MNDKKRKEKKHKKIKQIKLKKIEHIQRIISILKYQPAGLWIREIARQTSIHPEIVRRIISQHPEIFEEYADLTQYNINLKFIKLRKGYQKEYAKIIGDSVGEGV